MNERCESLHAYVDGELGAGEVAAFELHLAGCETCCDELPGLLALLAALDAAAETVASSHSRPSHLTIVGGSQEKKPAAGSRRPAGPGSARKRVLWSAAGMAALAATAVVWFKIVPPGQRASAALETDSGEGRIIEARLTYADAEKYRPLDVVRGSRPGRTRISLDRLAALERAKDWHGLAVASLLAGERNRAVQSFALAPRTPGVDSDRAALELVDGSQAALERALEAVDRALAAAPDNGAALWNRALVLAGLNLSLAAAREFDRVAALGEPGWADESRTRAAALRAQSARRRDRWKDANDAAIRLIQDGTPVPADLLAVPGYMTIMFYDAVRSAPSRARVEALLPMARTLDAMYRSDRLSAYVQRTAASDFRVRKPLSDLYRELVLLRPVPAAKLEGFLARLQRTAFDDLRLGALVRTGRAGANLAEYRRLAAASRDPWFAAIAEHELAKEEIARGDRTAAERRLREAIALAGRERLGYRALQLERDLVALHTDLRDLSASHEEAQAAYREATSAGEELIAMSILGDLASIDQARYAHGLARAYMAELLERAKSEAAIGPTPFDEAHACGVLQYANESLANISLRLSDPKRAREEISRVPDCLSDAATRSHLTLRTALVRAELYRSDHREEDGRLARESVVALRNAGENSAGQRAMLDYVQGVAVIDDDRAAGRRLLREAIARTLHAADDDVQLIKARAYSFSLLTLDAGRASEFAEAVSLMAETLEVKKPDRCAVAVAVDGQESVVAFLDARGEAGGRYEANRAAAELDVPALMWPAAIDRLRGCERVAVLATAPVLGAGGLLPPEIAWSYLLTGTARAAPPTAANGRRLVIANPELPRDLELAPLAPYPEETNAANVLLLRGSEATPTRVLLAMRDASVIEFHTHGLIANDVSEASYLVLSPEPDRSYRMTASDVSRVKLEASPLVILGACHAATSSRTLEGGTGLAEAFLRSGARGVIAGPESVQDLDARTFFAAVRERVLNGVHPAIAVREERLRRAAPSHDESWISGIVVFE